MVGVLVHGNNHFILYGPRPDEPTAVRLSRHWSLVRIGERTPASFEHWEIRDKEFRENLQWAVVVPGEREMSPGANALLEELAGRGVSITRCVNGCW